MGTSKYGPANSISRPKLWASGRNRNRPPSRILLSIRPTLSASSSIASMFSLVWMTPFGGPVVPEV